MTSTSGTGPLDRAARLAVVAIVVVAAVAAAPVVLHLLGRGATAEAAVASPPPERTVDLTPLHRLAPFGVAAATATGDLATDGLQLRGIMLATPAAASVALIGVAGGPMHGYSTGAVLPGGAVLDTIKYDLVVVRINGALATLALPGHDRGAAFAATASLRPPAAAPPLPPPAASDTLSLLGTLDATAGSGGFRVGAAPPDDLRRAGLRAGDVIERVDGQAIGDPARDRALFDAAVVAGRMEVDAVRDGRHVRVAVALH